MTKRDDIVEVSGVRLRLGPHLSKEIRGQISSGRYEVAEIRALRAKLAPGDVVMELGAGIGFLSTYCSKIAGSRNIFTFEANLELEPTIRETFALNDVSPSLELCVLTHEPGVQVFYVSESFWTSSVLQRSGMTREIKVPAKSLSAEIARIQPSLLMIDIEGGEHNLFSGIDLATVRTIVIELHPRVIGIEKVHETVTDLYAKGFRADREASSGNVLCLERGYSKGKQSVMNLHEAIDNLRWSQAKRATEEVCQMVPQGSAFILIDDYYLEAEGFAGRRRFFFLDRNGQNWGPPADDRSAIEELERLRLNGASFIVLAWPLFWWQEQYSGFFGYLEGKFRCVLRSERVVIFDLRG